MDNFKSNPPDCTCASSPFIYDLAGYDITADLEFRNHMSSSFLYSIIFRFVDINRIVP
jgi:hypothetical protein